MTPQEKAEALIKRFNKVEIFLNIEPSNIEIDIENVDCDANKQCALIAVDEIIKTLVELSNGEFTFIHNVQYWQEVKREIENIS
jgi:hypothetical protein